MMTPATRCPHYETPHLQDDPPRGRVELVLLKTRFEEPIVVRFQMLLCEGCAEELRHWILSREKP